MAIRIRLSPRIVMLALRLLAIGLFVNQLHGVGTSQLPGLLHPGALGSDSSNYYAAGLRLNAGHALYGPLLPGDRAVPGYPELYPAPLLSPPLVAVIWRPLALLPGEIAMTAWWAGGLIIVSLIVFGLALRGRLESLLVLNGVLLLQVPLALYLHGSVPDVLMGWSSPVAIAALSGNLNTYLLGLILLAGWAAGRSNGRLAGGVTAIAAAFKLGPALLGGWLVGRGGRPAALSFGLSLVGAVLVGLVGAGLSANIAYVKVALGGGIVPTPLSLPGLLNLVLHVDLVSAERVLWIVPPLGLMAGWALRRHRRLAFTVAVLAVIYSSPVVLTGNLATLVAVAVPWPATLGGRFHPGARADVASIVAAVRP